MFRTKRDDIGSIKVLKKFPDHPDKPCPKLHENEDTPFTAIILYKTSGRLLCMGSIVDSTHILSAKRCYERTDAIDVLALVGYSKAWWGNLAQVIKVKKIVRHEYEVVLLRLKREIRYTDYVKPVRLPTSVTKFNEFAKTYLPPFHVVGFFVDRYDVPGDFIGKEETYAVMEDQDVKYDECAQNYTKLILHKDRLFCVAGNASYCWGGRGAPVLIWKHDQENFLQVGVVIADNCTVDTTGPLLVARLDHYADWIHGNAFHGHLPS